MRFVLDLEGGKRERELPTEHGEKERDIGGLGRFVACAVRERARGRVCCERCVCVENGVAQ